MKLIIAANNANDSAIVKSLIEECTRLILHDPSCLEILFIQLLPIQNRLLEFFLSIFAWNGCKGLSPCKKLIWYPLFKNFIYLPIQYLLELKGEKGSVENNKGEKNLHFIDYLRATIYSRPLSGHECIQWFLTFGYMGSIFYYVTVFCLLQFLVKKILNEYVLVFLDHFDMLMSKMIFKK